MLLPGLNDIEPFEGLQFAPMWAESLDPKFSYKDSGAPSRPTSEWTEGAPPSVRQMQQAAASSAEAKAAAAADEGGGEPGIVANPHRLRSAHRSR